MVAATKTASRRPAKKKSLASVRPSSRRAPSAAGNSPDAIAFLIKQHREARRLFSQFEKVERKSEKEKIANTVCKMLQVHTRIEEEIFYPACRAAGLEPDLMDEADVEHASAKELIAQVEGKSANDSHYAARVKVLGEYVNHHVEEEESEMFKKARRLKLDMNEIGRQLKDRTAVLKGDVGLIQTPSLAARFNGLASRIGL